MYIKTRKFMKAIYSFVLLFSLIATACQDSGNYQLNHQTGTSAGSSDSTIRISNDTLLAGDIFITTGPAGKIDQKEGKIVLIADSGRVMTITQSDDKLIANGLTGSTRYLVKTSGDKFVLAYPDSDKVLREGRMLLVTDGGEMLEVKLLGERMVVLTANNTMIPLEKK
jgi:hypothetical protein